MGGTAIAAERAPRLQRCLACGLWQAPLRLRCGSCGATNLEWAIASGAGRVQTFTVVWQRYRAGERVPYTVALVELEEGPRILARLEGVAPDLRLDQRVSVEIDEAGTPVLCI